MNAPPDAPDSTMDTLPGMALCGGSVASLPPATASIAPPTAVVAARHRLVGEAPSPVRRRLVAAGAGLAATVLLRP